MQKTKLNRLHHVVLYKESPKKPIKNSSEVKVTHPKLLDSWSFLRAAIAGESRFHISRKGLCLCVIVWRLAFGDLVVKRKRDGGKPVVVRVRVNLWDLSGHHPENSFLWFREENWGS